MKTPRTAWLGQAYAHTKTICVRIESGELETPGVTYEAFCLAHAAR